MGLSQTVYLDTCIIIYLIENHPQFGQTIRQAISQSTQRQFVISPLVKLECLVGPLSDKNTPLINRYKAFFTSQISLEIPATCYETAAHLRATHRLKTPDALHLATALHHNCDEFWTNDTRLHRSTTIAINILSTQPKSP